MKKAEQNEGQETLYKIVDEETVTCLIKYIRKKFLYKKQLAYIADLLSHFQRTMNQKGFTVERSTKKKLRKKD